MKIDMTVEFVDLDGEALLQTKRDGKESPLTLRAVCENVLLAPVPRPQGAAMPGARDAKIITGEDKVERYVLSLQIHSEDEPNLGIDDVAMLKRLIGESDWAPLVVGQAWEALDPKVEKDATADQT